VVQIIAIIHLNRVPSHFPDCCFCRMQLLSMTLIDRLVRVLLNISPDYLSNNWLL